MIKLKTIENKEKVDNFIETNIKKSQFTYSMLINNLDNSFYYEHEDSVIAFYYVSKGNFLTLIFKDDLTIELKQLIMKDLYSNTTAMIKVIDSDVDYSNIYYIKEPNTNTTYTATLQNKEANKYKTSDYVIELDESHIPEYINSIEGVFGPISEQTIQHIFKMDKIYGLVRDGKILSAVTVAAITDNYCVLASVFTHPRLLKKGLATEVLNHVLNIYATNNRTIAIQYSSDIAKHLYLKLGFIQYDNLYVLHRKHTHLCTKDKLDKVYDFLIEHKDQATFIPGNMNIDDVQTFYLKHEEKIVGLYSISKGRYITLLPGTEISNEDLEFLLVDTLSKTHHAGTIVTDQISLLEKYFQITGNTILSKLEYQGKNNFKTSKHIRLLTLDDYEQYKICYQTFEKDINYDNYKINLELGLIYGYFKSNKLISIATTASITAYSGVIVAVATLEAYQKKGYATKVLKHMLHDLYSLDRSLYIFYDNPVAGKIYENIGFKPCDKLQMIKRREND